MKNRAYGRRKTLHVRENAVKIVKTKIVFFCIFGSRSVILILSCAVDMAPKRAKQLEQLADLLSGEAPVPAKKRPKKDQPDGVETPSTTTPGDTPANTPSEVGKTDERPKKRIKGKGGGVQPALEEPEPPAKVPKAKSTAAKAKAKVKKDQPPMPTPTWDNFALLQEHFSLTEEECTEVLLRVCGPNPKGEKYWDNFKVPKPDDTAPVEEPPIDDDGDEEEEEEEEADGAATPLYTNEFDSEMSDDVPEEPSIGVKGTASMAVAPDNVETQVPNEAWCLSRFQSYTYIYTKYVYIYTYLNHMYLIHGIKYNIIHCIYKYNMKP